MISWTIIDHEDSTTNNNVQERPEANEDSVDINEPPSDEVGISQGDFAPDFELETLDGDVKKLSDFRGDKIMLNFWATWCPPCRAEMPDMQQVYEDHDIEILAVNLTETETSIETVDTFVDDFELTFPIMLDKNIEVADKYEIQPVPTSFMIDTEGRIQLIQLGPMNEDMIVQTFAEMN